MSGHSRLAGFLFNTGTVTLPRCILADCGSAEAAAIAVASSTCSNNTDRAQGPVRPAAAPLVTLRVATAALRKLVPDAGSYVSESNYFNPRWQAAYWGGNYRRLQAVKAKCDPTGLFFGHNGVGSEDWSRDGFTQLR